jgi:hypothetical protein
MLEQGAHGVERNFARGARKVVVVNACGVAVRLMAFEGKIGNLFVANSRLTGARFEVKKHCGDWQELPGTSVAFNLLLLVGLMVLDKVNNWFPLLGLWTNIFQIIWRVEICVADIAHVVRGDVMLNEFVWGFECALAGGTAVVNRFLVLVQLFLGRKVWFARTIKADMVAWRLENVLALGRWWIEGSLASRAIAMAARRS